MVRLMKYKILIIIKKGVEVLVTMSLKHYKLLTLLSGTICKKNYLYLRIKTESVTAGKDATVFISFLGHWRRAVPLKKKGDHLSKSLIISRKWEGLSGTKQVNLHYFFVKSGDFVKVSIV